MTHIARVIAIAWLVGSGMFFTVLKPIVAAQETQDTLNERVRSSNERNTEEIRILRAQNLDARVRTLEDTVTEVKWLGRTAASILLGQLLLGILSSRKKTS